MLDETAKLEIDKCKVDETAITILPNPPNVKGSQTLRTYQV